MHDVNGTEKKWYCRPIDERQCAAIAAELNLPLSIVSILARRGLASSRAIFDFLNPALDQLPSPFLMKGMQEAVEVLYKALVLKRPVLVYGDYDVDGTTGVAVLALFLQSLGIEVSCYQPNRFSEGYGFHFNSIVGRLQQEAQKGVLVTVDCGISDAEELARARRNGFSVIVTDHHQPPQQLPDADAILNPLQPGCSFPFKGLAGVGVAFYLTMGLRRHLADKGIFDGAGIPNLKTYLDLVAVGTIADMVPLFGVNRILAKAGLEVMAATGRPGLNSLFAVSGIDGGRLQSEDIAFRIGPRINAASRIGDPAAALELLMTEDPGRAAELAAQLDADNSERKRIGELLYQDALVCAEKIVDRGGNTLVVHGEDWHSGVLGIVASRLANRFFRPAVVLTVAGGVAKGSGRSIPDLNLFEAVTGCSEELDGFGGHSAAVGVTLQAVRVEAFASKLEVIVSERIGREKLVPAMEIDWHSANNELADPLFISCFRRLQPFGVGNPEPVFSGRGRIRQPKVVGRDHLKFYWQEETGAGFEAIGFGFGDRAAELASAPVELAYYLRPNFFRGRETWQVTIADIRQHVTG